MQVSIYFQEITWLDIKFMYPVAAGSTDWCLGVCGWWSWSLGWEIGSCSSRYWGFCFCPWIWWDFMTETNISDFNFQSSCNMCIFAKYRVLFRGYIYKISVYFCSVIDTDSLFPKFLVGRCGISYKRTAKGGWDWVCIKRPFLCKPWFSSDISGEDPNS